jgi:hypothetical protein
MDMKIPHSNLSEVSRMVFVEVDAMMVLTTSVTTTSRMFTVFTDTTMSMRHMATKLSSLFLICAHVAVIKPFLMEEEAEREKD